MRISDNEKSVFINVLSHYIKEHAELRLYGSRADDNAKGGDIDLLLIVSTAESSDQLMYSKAKILSEIKKEIGEQIIDLKIMSTSEIEDDVFTQSILAESILLYEWQ